MNNLKDNEEKILKFWEEKGIYKKLQAQVQKGKKFYFLDGPPYANFTPHVGHIKNTIFKDLLIRRAFMMGKNVLFQPGFDTHGLPVENMVEKKLNLQSKKDIEKYGVSNFMTECKRSAIENKDVWMNIYKRLGSLYYLKTPYLTYEDSYLESAWWSFAQMFKKKMVYEGEKPVMWCSHCETSLAGYEVTDSYKDLKDPGVYLLFKLKGTDEFLLVYTTTPWTLPANVAIAIAPKEDYAKVEVAGKKLIIAEKRLEKLTELEFGYKVLEKFKGEKLLGKKYEPLLDVPLQRELASGKLGRAHEIIASIPLLKERVASKIKAKKVVKGGEDLFEEFVTMTEGTGCVHSAPGHGKTDFIIGQHYKLACVSPVNEQGEMMKESGFSGFVKKADKEIMQRLENEGKLLHHELITHSYPLCWRCKNPLIFRLSKQLFFKIDSIKKIMKKENKKVNWMPEFARERFDNWVENAEDWNISRQRYWGIPIPLWKCGCGEEQVIESKNELEKLSGKKVHDLHFIDDFTIKCKCGKNMKKIKGILDVWFDSGIAPWASLGYPFKNKELFEEHFPLDRINEAQDQIRGWFYSLMFCSAAVFNKAPYKSISMTGWVVDKEGQKMSKSVGNVLTGDDALKELGADVLRYYFCADVNPYELQKFNLEIAKKEIGRILTVLWNLKNLTSNKKIKGLSIADKWILSKLNSSLKGYQENLELFELKEAMRSISDFILNHLSRNYIQMTRDKDNSTIVTHCLKTILLAVAPIVPFISEEIWQELKKNNIVKEESIHLSDWPKVDNKKIDSKLEKEFGLILSIIEMGLAERGKINLGLKWPLAKATIFYPKQFSKEMEEVILNQLNVKKIEWKNASQTECKVELDSKLTPELEQEGFAREIMRRIQSLRKKNGFNKEDEIRLAIHSDINLNNFEKDIKGKVNAKELTFDKKEYKIASKEEIKGKSFEISFQKV